MASNTMICTISSMYIRNKPSPKGEKIGVIFKDQETSMLEFVYGTEETGNVSWIKHKIKGVTGYSLAAYLTYKNPPKPTLRRASAGASGSSKDEAAKKTTTTIKLNEADIQIRSASEISPKGFRAVLGLPYHFMETTDPRYSDKDGYGTEFTEKILSRCPILFISPGHANFMSSYKASKKTKFLKAFFTKTVDELSDILSGSETGRYYTFAYALEEYFNYVNPMCHMAAMNLNIGKRKYYGTILQDIHWGYEANSTRGVLKNLKHLLGSTGKYSSIPFYLNGETSISESFSNSSTESQMASAVNGISDMAREINYLLGYSQSALDVGSFDMNSAIQNVTDSISDLMGKSSFISKLSNHLSTVATGGRMVFPKIWASSNFTRSYSVEIKLVSPDADPYSLYLNILVPLFHLVCLVAPHQITDDPNSYTNPFIVRCMYKGFFNIDMGLITSMSVTKGAESQWTPDGIPTTVTVNIQIEDLYDVMSITPSGLNNILTFNTVNNTALMDYIGTWCGIEMFLPEVGRLLNMKLSNVVSTTKNTVKYGLWSKVQDSFSTKIMDLYRGF